MTVRRDPLAHLRLDTAGAPPEITRAPTGAHPLAGGGVSFRVWAPHAGSVSVELLAGPGAPATVPLAAEDEGFFAATLAEAGPGTDYLYALDGADPRPDPRSRHQPDGVAGPSRVIDPTRFGWTDEAWTGVDLEDLVIYELHVGTFTAAGTFDAAIERLPHLVELGVTAIELLPIAQFPGGRNWGYDGVFLDAPQSSYGGPEGLARLVDACHGAGLAVILDVVYNHLGPEGDVTADFGPYKSRRTRTPWGDAINVDGPDCDPVRRFIIDNALQWLEDYHVDGLRLDAIQEILDRSARPILAELAAEWDASRRRLGCRAWLIAESDLQDPKVCTPIAEGGWGIDAQWTDDFHHAIHTILTGDRHLTYVDFGETRDLRKALLEGFVLDGCRSEFRRRRHGASAIELPGSAHVVYIQNHDQVANGSAGLRLPTRAGREASKLAAAVMLCSPNLPMLFMGEELGATTPFHFFTSFTDPRLTADVARGRRRDLPELSEASFAAPGDPATFEASKLDWRGLDEGDERTLGFVRLYRDLIALRRRHGCLRNGRKDATRVVAGDDWIVMERSGGPSEADACLVANLSADDAKVPLPFPGRGWRRILFTADARYDGPAGITAPPERLDVDAERVPEVELRPHTGALYLLEG